MRRNVSYFQKIVPIPGRKHTGLLHGETTQRIQYKGRDSLTA